MQAVVSVGSNLGDKRRYLQFALDEIIKLPNTKVVKVSSIYKTVPQINLNQPTFFNAVIQIETAIEPLELLNQFHKIELLANRERKVKNGPRTLDIDIITYEDLSVKHKNLTLPHPRAQERQFVLIPWLEINPDAYLGEYGSIAILSSELADQGVIKVSELTL